MTRPGPKRLRKSRVSSCRFERVILISQEGSRTTMAGLYEIMQTLKIVPLDGERRINKNGFVLTGQDDDIVSYTEVGLNDGQIKGFTLVWPTGDEERRLRLRVVAPRSRRLPDPALASAHLHMERRSTSF